jgi:repressor LexA
MTSVDDRRSYPHLTVRQRDIMRFVESNSARVGYAPTLQEIAAAVGLTSPSGAWYQVQQLKRKGYLSRDFGRPRTTKLRGPLGVALPLTRPRLDALEGSLIPVTGRVAAGGTITAMNLTGQTDEYVSVPSAIAGSPHAHFALEVSGDSMVGRAIVNGDRVVVRYGSDARNGDVVIAQFRTDTSPEEDEVTIKTYRRIGGRTWLMPENSAYEPISGEGADVKIIGRVVHLCRMLR